MFTSAHDNIEFLDRGAPLGNNDHAMINFGYKCTPESSDKISYEYDKADFAKFKEMMELAWANILYSNPDDVNAQWVTLGEKYEEADKLCVWNKDCTDQRETFSIPLDRKNLAKKRKKNTVCGKGTWIPKMEKSLPSIDAD